MLGRDVVLGVGHSHEDTLLEFSVGAPLILPINGLKPPHPAGSSVLVDRAERPVLAPALLTYVVDDDSGRRNLSQARHLRGYVRLRGGILAAHREAERVYDDQADALILALLDDII